MTQDEIVAARKKVKEFTVFVYSLRGYQKPGIKNVNKLRIDGVDLADQLAKALDDLEAANQKIRFLHEELYGKD